VPQIKLIGATAASLNLLRLRVGFASLPCSTIGTFLRYAAPLFANRRNLMRSGADAKQLPIGR